MAEFTKMDRDITEFKPRMHAVYVKNLADLRTVPFKAGMTVQVKADGEFSLIHIDRNEIYALNRFGRKTTDLPVLRELHKKFLGRPLEEAELLAEMYGVDENGRPVSLPNFVHYLKGNNKQETENRIHLGIFDFVKIVGTRYQDDIDTCIYAKNFDSVRRFNMLEMFNGKLCHVLEYIIPKNPEIIGTYYEEKIKEGWEGLVIRTNGDTYKAKPNCDVDAVIIGINKNNKGYSKGIAKSVKVALMPTEGSFVELGDATVPREDEARALFELTRAKVNENDKTAFVKPLVVVKIDYISLFPDTTNSVYKLLLGGMTEIGTMKLARMKSPRVVGYRKDKHACTNDVGLNQIDA